MGPLIKLILLNVITYLILKFVVPNIPGSAPLPASLVFLYLLLTTYMEIGRASCRERV